MDELIVEGVNLIIHDTAAYITLLNAQISTDFLPSLISPNSPHLVFATFLFSSLDSTLKTFFKLKSIKIYKNQLGFFFFFF